MRPPTTSPAILSSITVGIVYDVWRFAHGLHAGCTRVDSIARHVPPSAGPIAQAVAEIVQRAHNLIHTCTQNKIACSDTPKCSGCLRQIMSHEAIFNMQS